MTVYPKCGNQWSMTTLDRVNAERIRGLEVEVNRQSMITLKEKARAEKAEARVAELERCEHIGCEETDTHRICDTHMNSDYPCTDHVELLGKIESLKAALDYWTEEPGKTALEALRAVNREREEG